MRTKHWMSVTALAAIWAVSNGLCEAPAPSAPAAPPAKLAPAGAKVINVKVDVKSDTDREYTKSKTGGHYGATVQRVSEVSSTKELEIAIRNLTKEDLADLKVAYYLMGSDVEFHNAVIMKQGNLTATVPALKETKVKTDSAMYLEKPSSTYRKDGRSITKPKSGHKFTGYVLQITQGDKTLAEIYEPADLKEALKTAIPYETKKK